MSNIDRPNFPIGFQWSFSPRSEIWVSELLNRPNIVDFVCLPVEASLLYGGPMADLLNQVSKGFQVSLSVGWNRFPPQSSWDLVYRDSLSLLSDRTYPGTIYFENFQPKLNELANFEIEMRKVTDATPVLNIPFQWHGKDLLWDELWLTEVTRKTKMQVCLRLDHVFADLEQTEIKMRQEKIYRLASFFKDYPLKLSEIRVSASESKQYLWEAQIETWKNLCFDEASTSAIVVVWNEPQSSEVQLDSTLRIAHSFRAGVDVVSKANHVSATDKAVEWERVFESVFPRLVQAVSWETLAPHFTNFLATLDQGEWDKHETLRRWPIYLKVSNLADKLEWIDLSMFDWAHFSAQFHPVEEQEEQQQLSSHELKANPTIQIVQQKNHVSVVYRARQNRGNLVQTRELAWYEAAILDELQESAKSELTSLVNHLMTTVSPQKIALERETWLQHIAEMAKKGLILYSQVDQVPK